MRVTVQAENERNQVKNGIASQTADCDGDHEALKVGVERGILKGCD